MGRYIYEGTCGPHDDRPVTSAWFAVFVLAGAAEAGLILWGHQLAADYARALRRYQPTPAVIMTARLDTIQGDDENPERHLPVITYRYVADDRWQDGDRLLQGTASHRSGKWAKRILGRYPPGARVTAYHDPNVPRDAFLLREAPIGVGILIAAGKGGLWFLGAYFLLCVVLWPRSRAAKQPAMVILFGHAIWQLGIFTHAFEMVSFAAFAIAVFSASVVAVREGG